MRGASGRSEPWKTTSPAVSSGTQPGIGFRARRYAPASMQPMKPSKQTMRRAIGHMPDQPLTSTTPAASNEAQPAANHGAESNRRGLRHR